MSLDVEYEVEDPYGNICVFGDLKDAMEFADYVGRETGEFVEVRRRVWNPKEEL